MGIALMFTRACIQGCEAICLGVFQHDSFAWCQLGARFLSKVISTKDRAALRVRTI